jgi:hypothetical protein
MKKVIFITSSKGGVGKSTYGKLVLHTAMHMGLPVAVADLDAAHPDLRDHAEYLEIKYITIGTHVRDANTTSAFESGVMALFIKDLLEMISTLPDNAVIICNTSSVGAKSLQPIKESMFPKDGKFYDQKSEVYGVFLKSTTESKDEYLSAMEPFMALGKEHTVTVFGEIQNTLAPEDFVKDYPLVPSTETVMRYLQPYVMANYVDTDKAAFGLNRDEPLDFWSILATSWWQQHVEPICNIFGFESGHRREDTSHVDSQSQRANASHVDSQDRQEDAGDAESNL